MSEDNSSINLVFISNEYHSDVSIETSTTDNIVSMTSDFVKKNGHIKYDESIEGKIGITENKDHLYGYTDTQVAEGEEADLHKYLLGCMKNPGHTEFIPVDSFTFNHLPERYRDEDLYEYIKATADLTVRVDVKMTSSRRPELWPKTQISYPFYTKNDKKQLRVGSGMVNRIFKFTDGYDDKFGEEHWKKYTKCWCRKCQNSDKASHMWWEFNVYTATHVVFDDNEASHTSMRLFYDKEDSPVVSVDQVRADDINIERDVCMLKCVTCDEYLGNKLNIFWERFFNVWAKVGEKDFESRDVDKLNFVVSHPHGCSKQISIGQWVNRYRKGQFDNFTYTTCTCPGSSGASVHCVGYEVGWWVYQFVHSGSLKSNLNCSGIGQVI